MKSNRALHRCIALLAVAGLALLAPTDRIDPADAKSPRDARRDEAGQPQVQARPCWPSSRSATSGSRSTTPRARCCSHRCRPGRPAWRRPPASSASCRRTRCTRSNVYEDGNMPFMQRITWTGIALHAGVLPGQPASHGCVRMPHAFAQRSVRPDGYRPARDHRARRHPAGRHRASQPVQAEPGPPGAGAGDAAARSHRRAATGRRRSGSRLRVGQQKRRRLRAPPGTCRS